MTNSLVVHLKSYVVALFKDIAPTYTKHHDLKRDQTRTLHELEHRGSALLTLDFPALLKHFDKCLSEGLYTPSRLPYGGCARGSGLPKLFGNLLLQIFENGGKLRDVPSISAICDLRQALGGMKKLELPHPIKTEKDAVHEYQQIERDMVKPTLNWGGVDLYRGRPDYRTSLRDVAKSGRHTQRDQRGRFSKRTVPDWIELLEHVCDRVVSQTGHFHDESELELPRHGPGVVSNLPRDKDKYLFPEWPARLEAIFPCDKYALPNVGFVDESLAWSEGLLNKDGPSRLITVPKTQKGPRLIASEPVQNQWIQQLLLKQLEVRIQRTALRHSTHIRSQSRNQDFAKRGSISGSFATVDLSSASDRLSAWLVERVFRVNPTLLTRLNACRTPIVSNGTKINSFTTMKLKKFAPMGSACTFPVQSVIYSLLAIASLLFHQKKRATDKTINVAARQVSVFGDDIVIPVDALGTLREMISYFGLKVNVDKTYESGNFRESCGHDYFDGVFVTPVKVTRLPRRATPSDYSSLLEVSNNFHRRGLWNLSRFIESILPPQVQRYLPTARSVDDGPGTFKFSFCGYSAPTSLKRWNMELQRREALTYLPANSSQRVSAGPVEALFQWFIEKPHPDSRWERGRVTRSASILRLGWAPIFSNR